MSIVAGVVGCGGISRFHFAALEKLGVRVKWVCDLVETAAKPYAAKFQAAYTPDYHSILADPEVNVVFILTISSTHKRMCLDAIRAGKAVVCEKTLAENPADALEIVRAAEAQQTIFYTSYMKRFIPRWSRPKSCCPPWGRSFRPISVLTSLGETFGRPTLRKASSIPLPAAFRS